tara:strand:+ start:28 stop:459 length:432 start_codon:yes stop_codon:yes gene_type:complete
MAHDNTVYKHTSWGRTRGPKNLAGANGTAIVVLAHDALPVTTGISTGAGARDGTTGYATENQRYLFLTVDPAGAGAPDRDIELWFYMHATGIWSYSQTVNCDAVTVPTTYKIEINGVDRVAFVRDAGAWGDEPDAVYAACSTF